MFTINRRLVRRDKTRIIADSLGRHRNQHRLDPRLLTVPAYYAIGSTTITVESQPGTDAAGNVQQRETGAFGALVQAQSAGQWTPTTYESESATVGVSTGGFSNNASAPAQQLQIHFGDTDVQQFDDNSDPAFGGNTPLGQGGVDFARTNGAYGFNIADTSGHPMAASTVDVHFDVQFIPPADPRFATVPGLTFASNFLRVDINDGAAPNGGAVITGFNGTTLFQGNTAAGLNVVVDEAVPIPAGTTRVAEAIAFTSNSQSQVNGIFLDEKASANSFFTWDFSESVTNN